MELPPSLGWYGSVADPEARQPVERLPATSSANETCDRRDERWGLRTAMVFGSVCGLIAAFGYLSIPQGSAPARADFVELGATVGGTKIPGGVSQAPLPLHDLGFTALNYYHIRDGKPGQDYPWLKNMKLIEPYRDTTLTVKSPREGFEYRWEVYVGDAKGDLQTTANGVEAVVVLTELDENLLTLEEVNADGTVARRLEETVMVKYVRREIRTLTEEEREELLDAMFELWTVRVDGGNGKEIYGEDYADIWAISRLHFKAATKGTCDHFHDGLGFLLSHSLISNTFEFSLQIVNPKLTLPYWDFTIESSTSADPVYDRDVPYTRTPLLQPSWFGTYDPQDHMVKDGRWAYTKIPSARPEDPGELETDIYGKLRSPWNTNDRPYLARGAGKMCQGNMDDSISWPTCLLHYGLATERDSLYEWVWESIGSPHGPVHFWMGGFLDCDETYRRIGDLVGSELALTLAFLANGHRKEMFCDGIWGCDGTTADVSTKPYELLQNDTCGCRGYDLESGDDYKFVLYHFDELEFLTANLDEDLKREIVKALCSGVINYGEHGQSSSSLDPTFWPMHPTMERLWQFSVLTGSVKDMNWPDIDLEITLPDGSQVDHYVNSYYAGCFGHRGSDVFPYGLLDSDVDGFKVRTQIRGHSDGGNTLTNREAMAAFDPRANSMNYIYDHFKWDHCSLDGLNFNDAWGDTSSAAANADKRFFQRQKPLSGLYTQFKRDLADAMAEKAAGE